ncbi:MAG: primosomal protein N' [Pseudomonadota bacterium]|nr:primosomal protein N' [Pseudomonadota bacterium]
MDPCLSISSRNRVVGVLLPLPLASPYDYIVPHEIIVERGSFVQVPFGRRNVIGVVWGGSQGTVGLERLREIQNLADLPPMPLETLEFIEWVSKYTLSKLGSVLRMAMSVPSALAPPKAVTAYKLSPGIQGKCESVPQGLRLTNERKRIIQILGDGEPRRASDIANAAGTSVSVVRGLAKAGVLEVITVAAKRNVPEPDPDQARAILNEAQAIAAKKITDVMDQGYSVSLIDGVTGSGKTEVYFEAIASALRLGRQVAVLLPEIALTANWLERFEASFGVPPVTWHSDLPLSERRQNWLSALDGTAKLIVGARSALMLPYKNLGLIVIDEEHDLSFKQEESVIYNARDMAIVRGRIGEFPIVLSSATPSLETLDNVWRNRYRHLSLSARYSGANLPDISSIDMRKEKLARQNWLSPSLASLVIETLKAGEQIMLFLNRRGYAPLTLCRACGHCLACPQCTAWLVEHRLRDRLQCHHCGYTAHVPNKCPMCQVEDKFAACGPGVERLAEEARRKFSDARVEIMSSDSVRKAVDAQMLVRRMESRKIDILIGTQIMAKGFHFPMLTLVGVIDADLGLIGGDLRAMERTYQLLHQVAGRAGRATRPGRVLLQTYQPEHPVMAALIRGDRDDFMKMEAEARRKLNMPPYGRLVGVIVSGPNQDAVENTSNLLGKTAPRHEGLDVLGPAPAPISVIRGRHRRRLLVRAKKDLYIQEILRRWVFAAKTEKGTRISIDIDPYSFN